MKRLFPLVLIAGLLSLPATAAAQSGSHVSASDVLRSDDPGLVGASGANGGDAGGSGGGSANDADAGSRLAFTGLEAGILVLAGVVLASSGVILRRGARPSPKQ